DDNADEYRKDWQSCRAEIGLYVEEIAAHAECARDRRVLDHRDHDAAERWNDRTPGLWKDHGGQCLAEGESESSSCLGLSCWYGIDSAAYRLTDERGGVTPEADCGEPEVAAVEPELR